MIIKVEMGEGIVAAAPHIIISVGIGSCMAVTLYDTCRKTGGLSHIMLPSSKDEDVKLRRYEDEKKIKDNNILTSQLLNFSASVFQYADTALPALLEEMRKLGCQRQNIVAKITGGARTFPSYTEATSIGEQNIRSVMRCLESQGIPLKGRDTGGNHGRSVKFFLETGRVVVKAFEKDDREI